MSRDGPPANSFVEPRKTGWLTKQGGVGIRSNWRKRWFVLDHHYLFYYTGEKERKPVGVVCLADYKCCRKATPKEGRKGKPTFILEKGEQADEMDYPVRNYLIYSDTDDDMLSWIAAINEEIQPVEGTRSPLRRGSSADVKIDDKAFDELSTSVEEGPKLTHLTAARPKVRGRRPPRKYTPYHEDDSKEDSIELVEESKTSNKDVSPVPSPEIAPKHAHRPKIPLKPKVQVASVTPKPLPQETEPTPGDLPPLSKEEKPTPSQVIAKPNTEENADKSSPVKPNVEQSSSVESNVERPSPVEPNAEQPSPVEPNAEQPLPVEPNVERPSPVEPNVEQPSPVEPNAEQSSPVESNVERSSPVEPNLERSSPVEQNVKVTSPQAKVGSKNPTSKPRPPIASKPRKRPSSQISLEGGEDKGPQSPPPSKENVNVVMTTESLQEVPTTIEPELSHVPEATEKKKDNMSKKVEAPTMPSVVKNKPPPPTKAKPRKSSVPMESSTTEPHPESSRPKPIPKPRTRTVSGTSKGEEIENINKEENKSTPEDKEEMVAVATTEPPSKDLEELSEVGVAHSTIKQVAYENVVLNFKKDGHLTLSAPQEFLIKEEQPSPNNEITTLPSNDVTVIEEVKDDVIKSDDVIKTDDVINNMDDVPIADINNKPEEEQVISPPLSDMDYEIMSRDTIVTEGIMSPSEKSDYELMEMAPPTDNILYTDDNIYDVPKSSRKLLDETTLINDTYDVPRSLSISPLDTSGRGTIPNGQHDSDCLIDDIFSPSAVKNTPTQNDSMHNESVMSTGSPAPSDYGIHGLPPERDAWGYSLVNKKRNVQAADPQDWLVAHLQNMEDLPNIPDNLQKAREILRLAKVVKSEAEEMRKEAERELELARRERHDAELLKKNAAEILRIAKDRLKEVS